MTDTEKKLLQAQHRLEEAQARDRVKERKARTRRLIQEGAILEKVLPEIEPQCRIMLQNDFSGRLRGEDLWLTPHNEFVHNMVKRDDAVMEIIRKKAAVVAGKPVRVRMGEKSSSTLGTNDKLAQLIGDMAGYDNMKVQQ